MKLLGSLLFVGLTMFATTSRAGDWSSGGGNAVVCFDDPQIPVTLRDKSKPGAGYITWDMIYQAPCKPGDEANCKTHITKIETYDLYHAKKKQGYLPTEPKLVQLKDGETWMDYFTRIATRLNATSPALGRNIFHGADNLPDNHVKWSDYGVKPVDDANPVDLIDQPNCVLATMAHQTKNLDGYFLEIDSRLYNHRLHSEMSKAILWMHEFAYQYALDHGQTTSMATRVMIGKVISNEPNTKVLKLLSEAEKLGFMPKQTASNMSFTRAWNVGPLSRYREIMVLMIDNARSRFFGTYHYLLLEQSKALIEELNKNTGLPGSDVVTTLGEAAGVLSKFQSWGFARYTKEPQRAEALLAEVKKVIEARALDVRKSFDMAIAYYKEELTSSTLLSAEKKERLMKGFEVVRDETVELARNMMPADIKKIHRKTRDEVLKQQAPETWPDIFCFEDLGRPNYLDGQPMRSEATEQWVQNLIIKSVFINISDQNGTSLRAIGVEDIVVPVL